MARVRGKGPAEQINVYDILTRVALRVYDKGRRYAVLVDAVSSVTELQYRTGLEYLKFSYLADILRTKKIVRLF